MSVTIGPEEPIVPANQTVLLTNKTTSLFLGHEMGLALKRDVPTKTSQLHNDSDFATNASVDEKIGVVTSSIPTKTSQLQNDSGFITVEDVPTKTSELVNDSDFSTNASVDEKIGGVTSSIPTKTSQLDNDSDFATKTELDTVNRNLTTTVLDMQNELNTKATTEYVDSNFATKTYVDEHAGNASNCVKLNETNELSQNNSVIFHANDVGSYSTGIKIFMNSDQYGILIAGQSIGTCLKDSNLGWQAKLDIPDETGTIATREYVDNKTNDKIKLTIFQDMSVDSATHTISILQNYQDNTSIIVNMNPHGRSSGYDTITLDIPLVQGTTFSDTYQQLINIGNESTGGSWYIQIGDKFGNTMIDNIGNSGTWMLDNIVYAKVFNEN